jgi:YrhK-like protein
VRLIGALFAGGSLCFAIGPFPGFVQLVGPGADAAVFFAGSILFTSAAALQCVRMPESRAANLVQLAGTIFFNISTFDALLDGLSSEQTNRLVWTPDVFGSICFLVASTLAWLPARRSSIAVLNLAGSVFFGISAIASYVVPKTGDVVDLAAANVTTALGALCFLAGAVLLMRQQSTLSKLAL